MSMVDERPSNYIKDGKIYSLIKGKSYNSCGFTEVDPDITTEIGEATEDAIAVYLEKKVNLYDYDRGRWIMNNDVHSVMQDEFGNDMYVGSRILFMDTDSTGRFMCFAVGTIVGDTKEYVKIKPDNKEIAKHWHWVYDEEAGRNRYKQYYADYILRHKDSNRVLLIRKLK